MAPPATRDTIQSLIADLGTFQEITDGLYHFTGFANVAFAAGRGGVLVADTSSRAFGPLAVQAFRKVNREPFRYLVYTHGHGDHAFGSAPFIADAAERGDPAPAIWGSAALPARLDRYTRTQGWQRHINRIQFNLRTDDFFVPSDAVRPTHLVEDEVVLDLDGERIELYTAQAETDDHLWIHLPERRAVFVGDLCISSMPNTGNPNKVQRYTLGWAEALERVAAKQPELLFPGHGPVWRGDLAVELPTETARALRFLHDAVLDRMNAGKWPWEIAEEGIELPPDLRDKPYLRPMYGCTHFIVQDVLRLYGGWWNGVAAELFPVHRRDRAQDIIAVAGREALLGRARTLLRAGEPGRAASVVTILVDADPGDRDAQATLANALDARGEAEPAFIGRNFLRNAAKRAREAAQ